MKTDTRTELDTVEARQAVTTGRVRYILLVSFVLAVLILAAILVWWSRHQP